MSTADGRVGAWISAWQRLDAAQKLKLEPGSKTKLADPLPELYWSLVAEAQVYTDLAIATEAVGFCVGDWLVEEEKQRRERRQRNDKLADVFKARKEESA